MTNVINRRSAFSMFASALRAGALANCEVRAATPDTKILEPPPEAMALETTGTLMLPIYRKGDIIIVSPSAAICNGDRVVMHMASGEIYVGTYKGKTEQDYLFHNFQLPDTPVFIPKSEIDQLARIVWASQ